MCPFHKPCRKNTTLLPAKLALLFHCSIIIHFVKRTPYSYNTLTQEATFNFDNGSDNAFWETETDYGL